RDPVCSPLDKLVRARVVVGSVTTSECRVLYVFASIIFFFFPPSFVLAGQPPSPAVLQPLIATCSCNEQMGNCLWPESKQNPVLITRHCEDDLLPHAGDRKGQ